VFYAMGNSDSHPTLVEQDTRGADEGLESEDECESEMWEAASWSAFLQKPFPGVRPVHPDTLLNQERSDRGTPGSLTEASASYSPPREISTLERSVEHHASRTPGTPLPLTPSKTIREWGDDSLAHVEAVKQYVRHPSTTPLHACVYATVLYSFSNAPLLFGCGQFMLPIDPSRRSESMCDPY
jgi:hypothetical protein